MDRTPIGELPGVVVHACALQNMLNADRVSEASGAPTWLLAASAALLVTLAVYRLHPWPAAASLLLLGGGVWGISLLAYQAGVWIGPLEPTVAVAVFGGTALVAATFLSRQIVERYAGEHAASQLLATGGIRARAETATVFFADVRGYTHLSENLAPAELMEVLNEHYRWMDGIIARHGGRVDKHIGDAMMAVFEGTREGRGHAERAVRAAEEMVRTADARRGAAGEIEFGIGIHTGETYVAELGDRKQEVGTIGDAVNVAARLEQSTRGVGVAVLISGPAAEASGRARELRELEPLTLKGKSEPVPAFTLRSLGA